MEKMKRKIPYFYIILSAFVLAFLIALFFFLRHIEARLADYEASLPQYEAERIFEEFYQPLNVAMLYQAAGRELPPFEDASVIQRYYDALTEGKELQYYKISTGLDDTEAYAVKAGDIRLSVFSLEKSGKFSKYGSPLYQLGEISFYEEAQESVIVKAPEGSAVYINGIALDDRYCTESGIETASCAHMPEGVSGVTYRTYKVDGLLNAPEVTVKDQTGETHPLTYDESAKICTAGLIYSETLRQTYGDYVTEAAQAIAAYMQMDSYFGAVEKYLEKGTPLYESTRTSETYFVMPHSGYGFEDVQAGEFYAYDANTFSCRVSFRHILYKPGFEDYVDFVDTTLYLRKVGDTYLIYDRENH